MNCTKKQRRSEKYQKLLHDVLYLSIYIGSRLSADDIHKFVNEQVCLWLPNICTYSPGWTLIDPMSKTDKWYLNKVTKFFYGFLKYNL
jgi:hypothetical protein